MAKVKCDYGPGSILGLFDASVAFLPFFSCHPFPSFPPSFPHPPPSSLVRSLYLCNRHLLGTYRASGSKMREAASAFRDPLHSQAGDPAAPRLAVVPVSLPVHMRTSGAPPKSFSDLHSPRLWPMKKREVHEKTTSLSCRY